MTFTNSVKVVFIDDLGGVYLRVHVLLYMHSKWSCIPAGNCGVYDP